MNINVPTAVVVFTGPHHRLEYLSVISKVEQRETKCSSGLAEARVADKGGGNEKG